MTRVASTRNTTATAQRTQDPNSTANRFLKEGLNYLKAAPPYVFGGGHGGPQKGYGSVDCSGLAIQMLYKAGVKNPENLVNTSSMPGKKISRDQLQPGDLCYKNGSGAGGHVAIYIGNGKILESYSTGKPPRIRQLGSQDSLSEFRRIFDQTGDAVSTAGIDVSPAARGGGTRSVGGGVGGGSVGGGSVGSGAFGGGRAAGGAPSFQRGQSSALGLDDAAGPTVGPGAGGNGIAQAGGAPARGGQAPAVGGGMTIEALIAQLLKDLQEDLGISEDDAKALLDAKRAGKDVAAVAKKLGVPADKIPGAVKKVDQAAGKIPPNVELPADKLAKTNLDADVLAQKLAAISADLNVVAGILPLATLKPQPAAVAA